MEFGGYRFWWVLPLLAAIGLIESLFYARFKHQPFPWGESAASLGVGVGQAVKKGLTRSLLFGAALWLYQYRLFTVPLDTWWGWVLLFFATEFVYYWHHRWGHTIRWLWATHSVHHSGNHLTFLAAIRLGWTGEVSAGILMFAPLVILGFDPVAMFAVLALNLLYQFWIHSEFIPKLGWFDLVFNSPSNHRVHHASNPIYLDKNYGGVTMIFDHMFGSFQREVDSEPCRYGLVHPLWSNNPLRIAFNEWIAMARDVMTAKTWRARFMHMFGPPGWTADGKGTTTADLQRAA